MDLTFEFVGSGDAFGNGGRFNTCFVVTTSSICLLIDCGAWSLIRCTSIRCSLTAPRALKSSPQRR